MSSLRRGRECCAWEEACAGERLRYVAQQWLNGESRIEPLRGQLDKQTNSCGKSRQRD
jgi:hypothetical protein